MCMSGQVSDIRGYTCRPRVILRYPLCVTSQVRDISYITFIMHYVATSDELGSTRLLKRESTLSGK